jgi:hypothetical protein
MITGLASERYGPMPVVIETSTKEETVCHNVGTEPSIHFRLGDCNIHVARSNQNLLTVMLQCLETIIGKEKSDSWTCRHYNLHYCRLGSDTVQFDTYLLNYTASHSRRQ